MKSQAIWPCFRRIGFAHAHAMTRIESHIVKTALAKVLPVVTTFAVGQGAVQAITLVTGFLLLHWLQTDDYAKYGLVFGFQSTVNILTDLGFSGTVIALVGQRTHLPSIIGGYIRAGISLRLKILAVVFPPFILYFLHLTAPLQWGTLAQWSLLLSILVSIYFSAIASYYTCALLLAKKLQIHYSIWVSSAIIKLLTVFLLYRTGVLTGNLAVWINTFTTVATALAIRTYSTGLLDQSAKPSRKIEWEMIHFVLPNLPSIIFYAVQGQISIFLIATFGHGQGIAQVAALSRLGQIFVFFGAFNSAVLEPWFARARSEHRVSKFLVAMGVAVLITILIEAAARIMPAAFLAILGTRYADLKEEVAWVVGAACINYLGSVIWTANLAFRFIYWRSTWVKIVLIIANQILFISFLGAETPIRAIQFGLCGSCVALAVESGNYLYGLWRGPRGTSSNDEAGETEMLPEEAS